MNYLDFDLLIEQSVTGYRARVINSPAGQANQEFQLPFSDLELRELMQRLENLRKPTRGLASPIREAAQQFGSKLFNAIFVGDLRTCWQSSLNAADHREAGLRLRLRFSGVPELLNMPWEFLYDETQGFPVLSVKTPLVRDLDLLTPTTTMPIRPPLRVLVMIANPRDYQSLDVAKEWQIIKDAVAALEQSGSLIVERLPQPTFKALQQQLLKHDYHIFHFIGHGAYDQQVQDGVLFLEDQNGHSRPINGQDLGIILHDRKTFRLALLNCCEGGQTSESAPFVGVCQSLLRKGIPAVIAMQFAITDQAAIILTRQFYASLAGGLPVDSALAEARRSIFVEDNNVEWGTPVLYMRTPDGQIIPPTSPQRAIQWWQQWYALLIGLAVIAMIAITMYELTPTPAPTTGTPTIPFENQPNVANATTLPTATPQPTATDAPIPTTAQPSLPANTTEHVYNFDDGSSEGWNLDTNWAIVPIEGGGKALQVNAPQNSWPAIDRTDKLGLPADIRLQVRFRLLQPTEPTQSNNDLKLSIRANTDHPDFESYSVYTSFAQHNIRLLRRARSSDDERVLLHEPVEVAWQLNHWYTLSIEARGSRISVWLDDKELMAVEDTVLTNGNFYITAAPSTQIQFDEIRLATP